MLVSSSAFRTKCYPLVHMANSDSFNYTGMERWKGRVAIVTGASAGIGYELSKRLVQLGVVVVGCARNIAAIEVRRLLKPRSVRTFTTRIMLVSRSQTTISPHGAYRLEIISAYISSRRL